MILEVPHQIFFSANNFCLPTDLCFIHSILILSRLQVYISSNKIIDFADWVEIESYFIKTKSYLEKILQLFLFGWSISIEFRCWGIVKKKDEKNYSCCIYIFDIYIYIYIYIYHFCCCCKVTCNYMFLNPVILLPIWQENGHVFSCTALNSVLFFSWAKRPNTVDA